jgi:hypothetical protein
VERFEAVWLTFDGALHCLAQTSLDPKRASSTAKEFKSSEEAYLASLNDPESVRMLDLVFVALTILFFVVAIAYVNGCEKLR